MKKNSDNTKAQFRKIIYFDEGSATDLIYIEHKGKILESIVSSDSRNSNINGEANASVNAGVNILSLLKAKLNLHSNAAINLEAEKLVSQAITNTVLTDYLNLKKETFSIFEFNNAKVVAYPNSITYLKLFTPYLAMAEGKQQFDNINIDMQLIDKALTQSKGYYEMILEQENVKNVLRFNLQAFHNSYTLGDLLRMELTFHAVKVGKMKLEELDIGNEFKFNQEDNIADGCAEALKNIKVIDSQLVDVYDVILAGVYND